MNLQVVCYIGLLRFPEQLEPALSLLPDPERDEAKKFLDSVKSLPKAELTHRWAKLREEEAAALQRTAYDRAGLVLDELSTSIRPWCVSWIADQHG